jgi:hypothetical protein
MGQLWHNGGKSTFEKSEFQMNRNLRRWTRLWLDRSFSIPAHLPREYFFPLALPVMGKLKLNGHSLLWAEDGDREVCVASLNPEGKEDWAFPVLEWIETCRNLIDREPRSPLYTKVPLNYWIPQSLRERTFQNFFNPARSVAPQIEQVSGIDALARALKYINPQTSLNPLLPPLWPMEKRAVLVVTMDVRNQQVFRQSHNILREKWEKFGVKAAWNFLTGQYRLDHAFVDELQHSGHEIGWHGHNTDQRVSFLTPKAISSRISQARYFFERYDVKGMRAENFLWSRALFRHVRHVIRYDCSMQDFFPAVEMGLGTATSIPFQTRDRIWEIPTTITSDRYLPKSWSTENRLALLIEQIDLRIALGGVVHFAFRPDSDGSLSSANQDLLDGLLEYLGTRLPELWHCLPVELYQYVSYIQRLAVTPSPRANPTLGESPAPHKANIEL